MAQELRLQAASPLVPRKVDRAHIIMLAGAMQPYVWTIDGQTWGSHNPVTAVSGERVELMFRNRSMMGHPMHLNGHVFQVIALATGDIEVRPKARRVPVPTSIYAVCRTVVSICGPFHGIQQGAESVFRVENQARQSPLAFPLFVLPDCGTSR